MARTKLNKTIDPKIWATVSSICSRNRSTDAEFIKPIGNDRNTLLLRYVAALLIMKKPCPESINDIDNIKTFKLVGNKFIELSGTLQEIQDLYNENKSDNNTNNITKSNTSSKTDKVLPEDPEETNDSWESIFDKYEDDNSDDDSFFAGLEIDNDDTDDKLSSIILPLSYDADIKTLFLLITNLKTITGFKEENKKSNDSYTYLKYVSKSSAGKAGVKLYKALLQQNWKKYDNSFSISTFFNKSNDDKLYGVDTKTTLDRATFPIDFTYNDSINNINKLYETTYPKEKSVYNKNIISTFRTNYKKYVDSIDNEYIQDIFKTSSLYEYILVSPDEGMIFTKRYVLNDHIDYLSYQLKAVKTDSGIYYRTPDEYWTAPFQKLFSLVYEISRNSVKYLLFNIEYEIRFTGKVNYYELLEDTEKQLNIHNTQKRITKLKKLSATFKKYILAHIYPLLYIIPLNINFISFDINKNPMYKLIATKYGNSDDNANQAYWYGKGGITKYYWYKPNKVTGLIKIHSQKYPGYLKYTTYIANTYDFVKLLTYNGWNVTGQISDEHDFIAVTSYKNLNNDEMYCINLTPKGAAEFKKQINFDEFNEI